MVKMIILILKVHIFCCKALIRKIDNFKRGDTKSIKLWGDGKAKRELMHVDDLAEAAIHF